MRIDSEDININMLNLKENDNDSVSEYNETSLSEQVNKNMEDIEKLMVELQRSETELRRRIIKDENNCIPSVNALNAAMLVATLSFVPFLLERSMKYSCLSAIASYSKNSLYVDSGIPSVSIRCAYAAICNASLAAKPDNIIRTSGCGKYGR